MSTSDSEVTDRAAASDRAQQLRLIEALLFASAVPLDAATIAERLPAGADIAALVAELQGEYRGRGVNLVFVAGGWTFRTAADLAGKLGLEKVVPRRLSRAGIETLAIIAYHQPVTRAEIENIRGVAVSSGTLDVLMETGWIAPAGRRETPGRPVTWRTTDAFLLHFGLADRRDLPGIEELKATGLVGPQPPAETETAQTLPFAPSPGLEEGDGDRDERDDASDAE